MERVTVAVPYYGVPDLVQRAVFSILAQSYADLRLVVIGDGEEPPLRERDSRLEVYVLPENRGTYYGLQLVLLASPDAWHAPVGADDWIEPDHVERLMALDRDAVALATTWLHDDGTAPVVSSIGHEGWHVGVFASRRLKAIGGYDPSARLSQDTHVLHLLDATGGYVRYRSDRPTYHVNRRPGSLTTSPATGMRSARRSIARARDLRILARCRQLRDASRMAAYRESLVPERIREDLARDVDRLRARLR